MHASTVLRSLVAVVAVAFAGSAAAQSVDNKDRPSKQGSAKTSATKPTTASKRLDFVPGQSIKETSTRAATPGAHQPGHSPVKQGSGCQSQDIDA